MSPERSIRRRALIGSTALVAGAAGSAVWGRESGPELLMVTAALEPFTSPPRHPLGEGMDIDLAREALLRGGNYRLRVVHVPWRRVLAELKAGQADFSAGVHNTAERRQFLAYSQRYGNAVRYDFYTRRGSGLSVRGLADLAGRRVGLMAGAEYPSPLQAAMSGRAERAADLHTLLRMLAAGRVDVVVGNELPARWLVQHQPYGPQLERQPYTHDTGTPTQMAFSRQRPGFEAALAAMNRGLGLLAKEQRWAALQTRYVGG